MPTISVPIENVDESALPQLEYALTFASEDILSARISGSTIHADVRTNEACESATAKIRELVERYSKTEFGLPQDVHFRQDRDLQPFDTWTGLLERRLVTPVGQGHVVLRGLAAQLLSLIDTKVQREFANHFGAELELYPSTILSRTLDRCAHFTSFPEHIDFVSHLKEDLGVLNGFAGDCRERGWSPELHDGRMALSDLAISPSCCYHCYEGMEGWRLDAPGRCVTAILACHRYEGANHRSLSRLRAFTMREVVFIGQPRFVIEARAKAEEIIIKWAKDWELGCTFETANDMFFTQDFAVKASFQRLRQAKKELRLQVPGENQSLSVFSSNFHAVTFGKAFNITVDGRPATTGCIAWGLERWVYSLFSQFGFEPREWPVALREELYNHQRLSSAVTPSV
jgi:seryl-tRNA synthetase